MVGPLGALAAGLAVATTEVEDVDGGPPGGAGAGDPRAPTTNAKKRRWRPAEIRERSPSTLRNIDGGPPGGARAGDPGVQRL
jgi:hypothetical protein